MSTTKSGGGDGAASVDTLSDAPNQLDVGCGIHGILLVTYFASGRLLESMFRASSAGKSLAITDTSREQQHASITTIIRLVADREDREVVIPPMSRRMLIQLRPACVFKMMVNQSSS